MNAIEVDALTYRYRRATDALHSVSLAVPEGAIYGLIGPNGAGKSTLLRCCSGLLDASAGAVRVFGDDVRTNDPIASGALGYMAEGVALPSSMTLARLVAYVAPLHARWDAGLATSLRERFALDPLRKLKTFSRGETTKAALLLALAARPRLLLLDEPFTGMDVIVKDELVRGLLAAATDVGTTMVVSSHDLTELETIIDHVGILRGGRLLTSAAMEALRERYRRVTVLGSSDAIAQLQPDAEWFGVARAGRRLTYMADTSRTGIQAPEIHARFPWAEDVSFDEPSLRDVFVALATQPKGLEPSEALP